ncbi:PDDEXK nuclease domain-containing protein [Kitasatospora sp. NPDC057223]|uniref:PDDEXK nuclease domain-containing protein n=1 Tax=Kitasatospora sp. NPDC057223 TaxID=3346055 RepID=UPI00363DFAB3
MSAPDGPATRSSEQDRYRCPAELPEPTRVLTPVAHPHRGRQYPLQVGSQQFRTDLLLRHLRLHRHVVVYVVVELKIGRAQPEHMGKPGFHTAVVDDKSATPSATAPRSGS